MGVSIPYKKIHTEAATSYSVALDASLFFCGGMNEAEFVSYVCRFLDGIGPVLAGAKEVYVCWDGDKPKQKLQTQRKRAINRIGACISYANQHNIVITSLKSYCESSVSRIYIDEKSPGEGEVKCVRFNGWKEPVECIYVLVNDNDTMLLLHNQPPYERFKHTIVTTNFKDIAIKRRSRPMDVELVEAKDYQISHTIPRFKVQFDMREMKVKGVVDIFHDTWACLSEEDMTGVDTTDVRLNQLAMLGMLIYFGNDYVNHILHAEEEYLLCMFRSALEFYKSIPEPKLQSTVGFDLLDAIEHLMRRAFECKLNKPAISEYCDQEAIYPYFYRVVWNFFYYLKLVVDMNEVVDEVDSTGLRYILNPFSTEIFNSRPHPKMADACKSFYNNGIRNPPIHIGADKDGVCVYS